MNKALVVTVGNDMMGDDGAGPMLAGLMRERPLADWDLLEAGNVPENHLFKIRELAPERVVIVDAADMGLGAGEIGLIDKEGIASSFLVSTHTLPLNYLMEAIAEFVPRVELIGVQPEVVAFGYPVSPQVRLAVERIHAWLERTEEAAGDELSNLADHMDPTSGGAGPAAPRLQEKM